MSAFSIDSMIRDYHEYMAIWENPNPSNCLVCEREIGNAHDTHAVAIKGNITEVNSAGVVSTTTRIVGHIPRRISAVCSISIRRGGTIFCVVTGARRYSADLPQGGLEIPCLLKFIAKSENEATKAKDLLESALSSVKGGIVCREASAQTGSDG